MGRLIAAVVLFLIAGAFVFSDKPTIAQGDDPVGTIAAMQSTIDKQATTISQLRTQVARLKPEETKAPERDERCEDVDANAIDWLMSGLNPDLGITLRGVQAVRSDDFEQVYFVAAEIDGPGFEGDGQIAVWAMNRIDEEVNVTVGALTLTVNDESVAINGDWFHGADTDAQTSMSDDGAELSIECARSAASS